MKSAANREGSALVVTLLLLALMLTLVLYYVTLVRLETQVSGFGTSQNISRSELDRALGEALAELENQHLQRAATRRTSLTPDSLAALVSQGTGGLVTGLVTEAELTALGWPMPAETGAQIESASWELGAETNGLRRASAWAIIPLTGLLDPEGMISGWNTDHLGYPKAIPDGQVFFSAGEFEQAYPDADPLFIPGAYSRDLGLYDYNLNLWQTNVTIGAAVLSMHPLTWPEEVMPALFQARYPGRDYAAIAAAFLDFRDGKTLPTNPDGITAVPVPMFNEVTASMTVRNLGDTLEITHQLDVEIWYPFPGNLNTNRYEVARTPALEALSASGSGFAFASVDLDDDWEFTSPGGDVEAAFAKLPLNVISAPQAAVPGQVIEMAWNLEGLEIEQLGGGVADRLPGGLKLMMPALTVPPSGGVERVTATLEVEDPVLNYDASRWIVSSTNSLSAINPVAIAARDAEALSDGWIRWTPAGRPGEWEEGWIGFLPLDSPWRSVDLFAEEGQWWLQHTRRPDWVPGVWRRDKVNPNANQAEAFKAVFRGLLSERFPGEVDALPLEVSRIEQSANELAAASLQPEAYRIDQRGEWSDELAGALLADGADRHAAESIIQQSLGRLDVGYQLYGLILCSELRTADGNVRSRQRQVYTIWLDPYPTNEGRIAMMKISWTSLP